MHFVYSFLISFLFGALMILLVTFVLLFLRAVQVVKGKNEITNQDRLITNPLLLLVFASIEELVARQLLIGVISHYIGLVFAFIVSAAVFTLLHFPNGKITFLSVLNLLLVSFLFGIIFVRFGLLAAIGFHYGWNLMQWPILGYPMYHRNVGRLLQTKALKREWLSGGEFGPEYSVIATIVLGIFIFDSFII